MNKVAKLIISVTSFDPLVMQLPAAAQVANILVIKLPALHLKVFDLSMGGIVPGAPHIGADAQMLEVTITTKNPEDDPFTLGWSVNYIADSLETLKEAWKIAQDLINAQGALL